MAAPSIGSRTWNAGDNHPVPLPSAAELAAARDRTIPDVLPGAGDPPLRVLFCGINPGLVSAATGHHFARPGNRFWPVLHVAGFTPRRLAPSEQGELARLGLGLTNLVPRASAAASELSRSELAEGGARLRGLVGSLQPTLLAVLGVTAYRDAVGDRTARIGPQPADRTSWNRTRVWVLPNPSGLNAGWSMAALVEEFGRLREASERRS